MKKSFLMMIMGVIMVLILTGCGSQKITLNNIIKMYNKIEEDMTSGEVIKAIGEPENQKESKNGDLVSYLYMGGAFIVDMRDGKAASKQIYYSSNNAKNIHTSKEVKTDIEDLTAISSKVQEGMNFKKVVEILGENFVETLDDWYYDYKSYTWYDKNDNQIEIEFTDGKASYVYDVRKAK